VIWVVDKKVVRHLLTSERVLAELPLRVSFEYALESGSVVDGSLSIKVLYNHRSVRARFPEIEGEALKEDVRRTASDAVCEHLALSGFGTPEEAARPVVVGAD
jgi:hypothetical protein